MANKSNEFDISSMIADMMSALMIIFLFISVMYMMEINKEKEKITSSAESFKNVKHAIYNDLISEFAKELSSWNAEIDKDTLSVKFKEPDIFFEKGREDLNQNFKNILNDFFPRYIKILFKEQYRNEIEEIRIEGHTSSEWSSNASQLDSYFKNMSLSQGRSKKVLEYSMLLPNMEHYREFLIDRATANGLSYSKRIIDDNGNEDFDKSRRVEFNIRTTAEKHLEEILIGSGKI